MRPTHPYDPAVEARDIALIARLQANDVTALDALVDAHLARLLVVAEIATNAPDIAQDAVQDVFIQLWETRHTIEIRESVAGYLIRATRHRAIDLIRRERAQARLADHLHQQTRESGSLIVENESLDTLAADELRDVLRIALRGLPARCREIFLLNREAGLSYAEIEATLGISNATIRNQMSRATKHIALAVTRGPLARWLRDE